MASTMVSFIQCTILVLKNTIIIYISVILVTELQTVQKAASDLGRIGF